MRFSIIIPAYNAENHIRKALDSIKSQSFTDYELIVICDSCEDNTEEIAKEYGAITESVNFHNDGLSRSRGLDIAKGDYVLFMDDDDWWLHEFVLAQLNQYIIEHTEVDVIAFSFIFKGIGYCMPYYRNDYWVCVWSKCWKRECIGDTRFPNVYSVSDHHFHVAMMKKNLNIKCWNMPFYYYNYLRPGSISDEMGRSVENTLKTLRWEKS